MNDVSDARPSSTVILVRDGVDQPEFLLVRRVVKSSFGGAHVFPGGVVDPGDCAAASLPSALDAATANKRLGIDNALQFYSAAVRELFEETGVLLTHGEVDAAWRDELLEDASRWPALLANAQVSPAFDALVYISEWITPPSLPKRYATRFFIAAFDGRQKASPCGGELTECRWMTATSALAAGDDGSIVLHPPTRLTLEELAKHASVVSILDWARGLERNGAPTIAAAKATLDSVRDALSGRAAVR